MNTHKVKGFDHLSRDVSSKAIISSDMSALRKRNVDKNIHAKMEHLSNRLDGFESSIDEIKNLLGTLLRNNGVKA